MPNLLDLTTLNNTPSWLPCPSPLLPHLPQGHPVVEPIAPEPPITQIHHMHLTWHQSPPSITSASSHAKWYSSSCCSSIPSSLELDVLTIPPSGPYSPLIFLSHHSRACARSPCHNHSTALHGGWELPSVKLPRPFPTLLYHQSPAVSHLSPHNVISGSLSPHTLQVHAKIKFIEASSGGRKWGRIPIMRWRITITAVKETGNQAAANHLQLHAHSAHSRWGGGWAIAAAQVQLSNIFISGGVAEGMFYLSCSSRA